MLDDNCHELTFQFIKLSVLVNVLACQEVLGILRFTLAGGAQEGTHVGVKLGRMEGGIVMEKQH